MNPFDSLLFSYGWFIFGISFLITTFYGLCRNPKYSTNCIAPIYGGDSACPPNRPCVVRLCRITFSGVIVPGGCHSGGGGGITRRSPHSSVKKNIFRSSTKPFYEDFLNWNSRLVIVTIVIDYYPAFSWSTLLRNIGGVESAPPELIAPAFL